MIELLEVRNSQAPGFVYVIISDAALRIFQVNAKSLLGYIHFMYHYRPYIYPSRLLAMNYNIRPTRLRKSHPALTNASRSRHRYLAISSKTH